MLNAQLMKNWLMLFVLGQIITIFILMKTLFFDFFVFSDKAKQCVVIINDILNNETNFYSALEKNLKYIEIMQ